VLDYRLVEAMKFRDYYKVMGVDETASADEIKKAYRVLARKYHPDVSSEADAEERFKELGEAYEVLKDPEKRREYDDLRKFGYRDGGDFRPPPGWDGRSFGEADFGRAGAGGFSDFFEAVFGSAGPGAGRGFREMRARGRDLHYRLGVELEEAFAGGTRTIHLQSAGSGQRSLNVKVPAGVTEGQNIRLRGQGEPGLGGGPPGDLYLEIEIKPHKHFRLDGKNVIVEVPIAPWEAGLGADITVPTLAGSVKLKIPAGARAGQKLRLKGKGLPGPAPGDQIAELKIVMPPVRTEDDQALLRRMAETMKFDPRTELNG
jgi:curved DNA-binding protein